MFSTPAHRTRLLSSENVISRKGTSTSISKKPLGERSVNITPCSKPQKKLSQQKVTPCPSKSVLENEDDWFDIICSRKPVKDTYEDIISKFDYENIIAQRCKSRTPIKDIFEIDSLDLKPVDVFDMPIY